MNNPPAALPPIGPDLPWLAPLAGHTDLPFRLLCREQGAVVACTEMISAKGLVYGERGGAKTSATKRLLRTMPQDAPLVAQLFGDEPFFLAEAIKLLRSWGYRFFDLNLGCPAPKVLKAGAGAALARKPEQAVRAAAAMLEAAFPLPVGCKLRLGWNRTEENYLELGRELEKAGAAWITLHPRHAAQSFSGRADWTAIAALKDRLRIPVIAGGDLFTPEDALLCLRQSGADGLMFARGALRNPAIFRDYLKARQGMPPAASPAPAEKTRALKTLILRHASLMQDLAATGSEERKNPLFLLPRLRGAVLLYTRDMPGSKEFRRCLSLCADWDVFYNLMEEYFKE
ncbi:MAG: tRNA-dihydrouridine synthase family protein [Deltaproteobacteria bacterium]|nr:tRNA-dihydrouridine synthase family protein [Deltaproteobacteria bacterium]